MNLVIHTPVGVGKTKRPWYKKWFFKKRDLSDSRYIYLWGHESLLSPREFNTVYNYVVGDCASMFSEKRQAAFDLFTRVSNVDFTEFCNEFEVSLTTNKDGFLQSNNKPLRYRYRVHTIMRDWDPMAVTRLGVQFDKSKYWNCILEIA